MPIAIFLLLYVERHAQSKTKCMENVATLATLAHNVYSLEMSTYCGPS